MLSRPLIHAFLNGTVGVCIAVGIWAIRRRRNARPEFDPQENSPSARGGFGMPPMGGTASTSDPSCPDPMIKIHRRMMASAYILSTVFLISYLEYHSRAGTTKFLGQGWIRPVYFFILITHTILAAAMPVMATTTVVLALRGRRNSHERWGRRTWPLWLYVSITGVIISVLLLRTSMK